MKRRIPFLILLVGVLSLQLNAQGTWSTLGTGSSNGVNNFVHALVLSGDNLVMGGRFTTQSGGLPANRVVRYNLTTNTWHSLGTGENNGLDNQVNAIAVSGDNVFVGGFFTLAGGQPASRVARFNLTTNTWHTLGTGTSNGVNSGVYALAVSGDNVFVGGSFTQAGGLPANRVARYNLTTDTWSSLGTGTNNGVNSTVTTLAVSGDDLFVGGLFTQAGGQTANYVARYNLTTDTWSSLGTGSSNGVGPAVNVLAVSGDNVFVGGGFQQAGGLPANRVARYNLTTGTWHSLGTGSSDGVSAVVNALALVGNNVFVGGGFDQAGGQTTNRVARFNLTTNTWHTLGAGTSNGVNATVFALAALGNNVFVGGSFTGAGGQSANYVARYTEPFTSVDEENRSIPTSYRLMQNYPNPFNPSTTIRFEVPRSGFVTLKVYNLLGQEVAVLVNEVKQAGRHEVVWEATGLPSGVYFYRMRAETFDETRRLVFAR